MLFEVYSNDGKRLMYTEYLDCIPVDHLSDMSKCGYKFKLDGKPCTPKSISGMCSTNTRNISSADTSSTDCLIYCKELDTYYRKQSEAAKMLNIDPAAVSYSIKTGRPTKGYTFERVMK